MDWAKEERLASDAQHALLLALRDFLLSEKHSGMNCFAQDPNYTDTDRKILRSLDVAVLDDPRAFLQVDDGSVVVPIAPNIPVRQIITDIARPAILLWDRVCEENWHEALLADAVSPRVAAMIRDDYVEVPIPEDREYFNNMALYIRKPKQAASISLGT
ncbi:hypothetical protein V2A60_000042 [Cordyceps javanica]